MVEGHKKIICVDFDGVIHWYRDGWKGGEIYDLPVPGVLDWLDMMTLHDDIQIAVYSSRSKVTERLTNMQAWISHQLHSHFVSSEATRIYQALIFPTQKPAAWMIIDDRSWPPFAGTFPTKKQIDDFKPWNKK